MKCVVCRQRLDEPKIVVNTIGGRETHFHYGCAAQVLDILAHHPKAKDVLKQAIKEARPPDTT